MPLGLVGVGRFSVTRQHPVIAAMLPIQEQDEILGPRLRLAVARLVDEANLSFGALRTVVGVAPFNKN